MTPIEFYHDKAAPPGSSFYYSTRFISIESRFALLTVNALYHELERTLDKTLDIKVTHHKLVWWAEQLHQITENQSPHPLVKSLYQVFNKFNFDPEIFSQLIKGFIHKLLTTEYQTFEQLNEMVMMTIGIRNKIFSHICTQPDTETLKAIKHFAFLEHWCQCLNRLPQDLKKNRSYFANDDLQSLNLNTINLAESKQLKELLSNYTNYAKQQYEHGLDTIPADSRYLLLPLLTCSKIQLTLLNEIHNDNYQVLQQNYNLTPLRQLWLAWRSYRLEKKNTRKLLHALSDHRRK